MQVLSDCPVQVIPPVFATTELPMKSFESPDDALPAPLPEGGVTELSGSCTSMDHPLEGLESEARKIEVHEQLSQQRDQQD